MPNQHRKLVVMHTNDVHSRFENMPKIADLAEQLRSQYAPHELLLIDCGDHMDRMRMETEGSGGLANVAVLNETGYELFVPGNNEGLTFPKATMEEALGGHAAFTVLGSNMYDARTGELPPWIAPWRIVDKAGIKIGVFGLTAAFDSFYRLLGWDVREPLPIAQAVTAYLRPLADIVIVVSHLGLGFDQEMAERIPGIDIILGAHTHHLLEKGLFVGSTYLGAAGKFGDNAGIVEIEIAANKPDVVRISGYTVDVTKRREHEGIRQLIDRYRESSRIRLSRKVARLPTPLGNRWDCESELGNLLADGIRSWTGSEIAVVNAGQILGELSAGECLESQLLEMCPSPINPCRVTLYGEQLLRALEEALIDDFVHMPIRGFGFRGKVMGTLCVSGMDVEYSRQRGNYNKISRVLINGRPLDPARAYQVGMIDMFTFGIGYMSLGEGVNPVYYMPEFIRDILRRQLCDAQAIAQSRSLRWRQAD